jgi:FkbM family methyltransferase
VRWQLDLREGIDFSIYLLGAFEPRTVKLYDRLVKAGDVVLDIGANVGSHTLPLAALVGENGKVHAFEPTKWAIDKLAANAALNPALATRIVVHQVMLADESSGEVPKALFSSWPLVGADNVHEQHRGRLMTTEGARTATLDSVVSESGISRLDFIKLDVDGYEAQVLRGAIKTLERFRPTMLFELAPYLLDETPGQFESLLAALSGLGYRFSDANSGNPLPIDAIALRERVPPGASLNVLVQRV